MNLQTLKAQYFAADQELAPVGDTSFVRRMLKSKASATWAAGPIFDTGWAQLAFNGKTVYVCDIELYNAAVKEIEAEADS